MKGLLIKDYKLFMIQKKVWIGFVLLLGGVYLYLEMYDFLLGYSIFFGGVLITVTFSYEELDNGSTFLFTLPFETNMYIQEKYIFGLILGLCAYGVAVIETVVCQILRNGELLHGDFWLRNLWYVEILCCILAVNIPIQVKFGAEKGRFISVGVLVILGVLCVFFAQKGMMDQVVQYVHDVPNWGLNVGGVILTILFLTISYFISLNIQKKKEY